MKLAGGIIFAVIFMVMGGLCMLGMLTGAPSPTLSWGALGLLYCLVADWWRDQAHGA